MDKGFLAWALSSGVLILAVLALRAAFGKRLTPKARCWLWLAVLLRLLIPGTVFQSAWSVASVAEVPDRLMRKTLRAEVVDRLEFPTYGYSEDHTPIFQDASAREQWENFLERPLDGETLTTIVGGEQARAVRTVFRWSVMDVLRYVWYAGMGAAALAFLASNLNCYLRLRKRRKPLEADCRLPVYAVGNLSSSCLFGRSIYVAAETAKDEEKLRHVLAHELSHYRHGDGLWAVLRCAALVLHWYNPLVWLAAALSRRDSELFADWGALKALGEDEREAYGMTLIALSARCESSASLLCAATSMTNGKRALRERVVMIARGRFRMTAGAALAVCLILAAAMGCAFTGAKGPAPVTPTPVPVDPRETPKDAYVIRESDLIPPVSAAGLTAPDTGVPVRIEPETAIVTPSVDGTGTIIETAMAYVARQIDYYNALGQDSPLGEYQITDAKIIALEQIELSAPGRDDESSSFALYLFRLEYRLLPDRPENVVLAGGMSMEDGWITEYHSMGQPLLLFARTRGADGTRYEPQYIGAIPTGRVVEEYTNPELHSGSGDIYTEAALDMYRRWKTENDVPDRIDIRHANGPGGDADRFVRIEDAGACADIWNLYLGLYNEDEIFLYSLEDAYTFDLHFGQERTEEFVYLHDFGPSFVFGRGRTPDGAEVCGRCVYDGDAGGWRMVTVKDGAHYWNKFALYYAGSYYGGSIASGAPVGTAADLAALRESDPQYFEQLMLDWKLEVNMAGQSFTGDAMTEAGAANLADQYAERWAGKFLAASEDSPFHASDAIVWRLCSDLKHVSLTGDPRRFAFDVQLAVGVKDPERFQYAMYANGWQSVEEDRGLYLFGCEVVLRSDDGANWHVESQNTGGSAGWGYRSLLGRDREEETVRYALDNGEGRILMMCLPNLRWPELGSEDFDAACRLIGEELVGDGQMLRDLYVMYGALQTDGAFAELFLDRYGYLHTQYEADPASYETALAMLAPEHRALLERNVLWD